SINASVYCRVESYEVGQKKCISDVRRTFCLFVTFDLLFITMLWIIELNVRVCVCVCVCVFIVDTCCSSLKTLQPIINRHAHQLTPWFAVSLVSRRFQLTAFITLQVQVPGRGHEAGRVPATGTRFLPGHAFPRAPRASREL
ncbi:unnamed protein product, partial [Tetraodon nigroviridis]